MLLYFKFCLLCLEMQDEETGAWYQHKGRDFKVPVVNDLQDGDNIVGTKKAVGLWPGCTKCYIWI